MTSSTNPNHSEERSTKVCDSIETVDRIVCLPEEVPWNLADSFAVIWQDGHRPECLHHNALQWMRVYPKYHGIPDCCCRPNDDTAESPSTNSASFVYCWDDAAPDDLADAIYHTTIQQKTWGNYVTMQQIRQYWDSYNDRNTSDDSSYDPDTMAVSAAAWFVRNFVRASQSGTSPNLCAPENDPPNYSIPLPSNHPVDVPQFHQDQDDRDTILYQAHGVAVWALAAEVGSQVPYHLDYAELLRYETGVIVPPIVAGTWHCTRRHGQIFSGGDYCVVVRGNGLDHYHRHGYKGKLQPVTGMNDEVTDNYHIKIPYLFNRMICQSGHLPHWSTVVETPVPTDEVASLNTDGGVTSGSRVVVGFNVFLNDVGPVIQPAPEHSEAFRVRVRRQQRRTPEFSNALSLKALAENPRLRRLLVLAKRGKQNNEWKSLQHEWDAKMHQYLEMKRCVSVKELIDVLEPSHRALNSPVDVVDLHVHIHKCWQRGSLKVVRDGDSASSKLIPLEWCVSLAE